MTLDPNEFLMAGGVPAARFDKIGTMVKGVVQTAIVTDQTDFQSGEILTWKDGSPRKQLVITVDTDEMDPEIEGDDGARRLYAKGQMLNAIRSAVRPHGGLTEGGQLAVKFVGEKPSATRGFNAQKLYQAWYQPPAKTIAVPAGGPADEEDESPF